LKNIRALGGVPLVAWTIQAAKRSGIFEEVYVSTDHPEIARIARDWKARVIERPANLSEDESLVIHTIRHAIGEIRKEGHTPELMYMMEPTCPFRDEEIIRECDRQLLDSVKNLDSVATFTPAKINPWRTWKIEDEIPDHFIPGANPWLRRQELPPAYQLNGGVYGFKVDALSEQEITPFFGKRGAVVMTPEQATDIDYELDFIQAESLVDRYRARFN
jgi:N-acylneuraminate cytidylyltransferase